LAFTSLSLPRNALQASFYTSELALRRAKKEGAAHDPYYFYSNAMLRKRGAFRKEDGGVSAKKEF